MLDLAVWVAMTDRSTCAALCSPGTTRLEDICSHVEDEDLSYCLSIAQRIAGSPFNLAGLQNRECRWVNVSFVIIFVYDNAPDEFMRFSQMIFPVSSPLYTTVSGEDLIRFVATDVHRILHTSRFRNTRLPDF